MKTHRNLMCALLSIAAVSLGCGRSGPLMPAGQTLTLVILNDGQPVQNAHVDLTRSGGGADLNEKGEAVIESVPPGEYGVVVYPVLPMSAVIPPADPAVATAPAAQPAKPQDGGIPKPFRDEATTPLKVTVQDGSATRVELDLKKTSAK